MTKAEERLCNDCPKHATDACGLICRNLQRKCEFLSDAMVGFDLALEMAKDWLTKNANGYIYDASVETYPDAPVDLKVSSLCWDKMCEALDE